MNDLPQAARTPGPARRRPARALVAAVLAAAATASCSAPTSGAPQGGPAALPGTVSVEQQAERLAADLGVKDPPDVDPVRLVKPEERAALVEACMAEQGFSARRMFEDGIPTDQLEAHALADYTCMASYPLDPAWTRPWGDEQWNVQYDWTVDELIPCLAARGFPVTGVPTREVFIATIRTDPFYPYAQIPPGALTNTELDDLNRACPQQAPTERFWSDPG